MVRGTHTVERHLDDFGKVQRVTGRTLGNLLAATEAVGDDEPVGRSVADGGHEFELSDGDGDVVLVRFEAEGTSHAAASGGGTLEVDAETAEHGLFGRHLH